MTRKMQTPSGTVVEVLAEHGKYVWVVLDSSGPMTRFRSDLRPYPDPEEEVEVVVRMTRRQRDAWAMTTRVLDGTPIGDSLGDACRKSKAEEENDDA